MISIHELYKYRPSPWRFFSLTSHSFTAETASLPLMTRGRKKDLTIPPSRALAQQRDYRARKARYLAELEEHCRRVEQENVLLKQEVESLRAGLPVAASESLNPQLVSASSDLMRDLSAASSSLERFQRLAYSQRESESLSARHPSPAPSTSSSHSQNISEISRLRPAFFPSPPSSSDAHDIEHEQQHSLNEDSSVRPPRSHSLRQILCLPLLSDAALASQRNACSSSPDNVLHPLGSLGPPL
ncbi:hypothetical protein BT96DRAFT_606324 [Gymnopus androsaceus JB14]|uniref:BZIP domain-containing protein n=1 Tax=Gymnopus androsaceus JB14 TaxID=1447944 RepID=A0A6A4HWS6_9AGAR|nr:hypothetical protein BT96DRAFT_606324 [Gymnopus androsaceus JB14]